MSKGSKRRLEQIPDEQMQENWDKIFSNMNIQHYPLFNIKKLEKIYSEKDGVEVKYVCTTDLQNSDIPADIFYRETPHPQFGNYYFGILQQHGQTMIINADIVESLEFGMIEVDAKYYYSQSHHDCKVVADRSALGFKMIDGGREYIRSSGGTTNIRITDGKFHAVQ
tara:strand:- start:213 stop:713 length:501 start_codon:yes stop_codon:yes gene_type:complete